MVKVVGMIRLRRQYSNDMSKLQKLIEKCFDRQGKNLMNRSRIIRYVQKSIYRTGVKKKIHGQYNSLYDLVLREQLLKFCDKDLQVWVMNIVQRMLRK